MKILGTFLAILMMLAPVASTTLASPVGAPMATVGGQITSVDSAAKSLMVKVSDPSGQPRDLNFVVAEDSKIIKDGTAVTLSDLKQGDKVTITYRPQDGKNLVVNIGVESKT